jgi:hypothetical protein
LHFTCILSPYCYETFEKHITLEKHLKTPQRPSKEREHEADTMIQKELTQIPCPSNTHRKNRYVSKKFREGVVDMKVCFQQENQT